MKLKVGDVVQNLKQDYSETNFVIKPLPAMTVGRVRKIYPSLELAYVKFPGHPLINFREDELQKVQVPRDTRTVQKPKNRRQNSKAK